MNPQNKPHPHAELIHAWADGKTIQIKKDNGEWEDCLLNRPVWDERTEYRIRPEEPSNESWKPKNGKKYYFLFSHGKVGENYFDYGCRTDLERLELGNCFRSKAEAEAAIPRVKKALKNLYSISDKKAHDLECVLYDKIDRLTKYPELDGKPLTDGEKALIKAIRKKKINKVFNESSSVLAAIIDDGHGGVVGTVRKYVAIVPSDDLQPISIVSTLKQIQAEQEAKNEAE